MQSDNAAIDLYKQINTEAAADFLGVTPRKLEQMRQHGNGPEFVRISPKCVRYRMKELIAFQDAHLRQNTLQS
ncbi:MAG: DNA-binding protein [Chromatiaceae bacterium]|nr:DNA-binding protein [Chromatiaceae bacterium]